MKKIKTKRELIFGTGLSIDVNLIEETLGDNSKVYSVTTSFNDNKFVRSRLKLEDNNCADEQEAWKRFIQLSTSLKVLFKNMEIV